VLREAIVRVERRGAEYPDTPDPTPRTMWQLSHTAREAVSPLERLETSLHPWVSFVIMPVFALANAGVAFDPAELTSRVAVAVATGLLFGKPIGVVLFSFVAVKLGFAALPRGVNWSVMVGAGFLAGIGFTMALFINGLAFPGHPEMEDAGKVGTLTGSLISAIVGSALLLLFLPKQAPVPPPDAAADGPGFLEGD
jgi:NhaA family Na+:H+ antiporter